MKVKVYPLHNRNKIREAPQLRTEMYLSHSFICKIPDEPCFRSNKVGKPIVANRSVFLIVFI